MGEKGDKNALINSKTWFLIVAIVILILALPSILVREGWINFLETGQIGDTIGGITAPFINIGAAILVYVAFLEQKRANELQIESLKKTQKEINQNKFQDKINVLYERYADFMLFSNEIILQLPNNPTEVIHSISNDLTIYFNKCDFILAYFCEFIDSYLNTDENDASMEDIRLLISASAMYSFRVGELEAKLEKLKEFAGSNWNAPCHDLHMHCFFFKDKNGAEEKLFKFGLKINSKVPKAN